MLLRPTYLRHVYSGLEAAQAFDVIYGSTFEHRLLSAALATLEHQRLVLGAIRLDTGRYDFPVAALGCMPKDAICIGFVFDGCEVARYNTRAIGPEEIQIYPAGSELLYHVSGPSRWITVTMPEELLQAAAQTRSGRPLALRRDAPYTIRLCPGERSRLGNLVLDAMDIARRLLPEGGMTPELANEISESLLAGCADALLDAAPLKKSERPAIEQRYYRVLAACERLVFSGGVEIDLAAISRRSGYTRRSLEMIFRRSVGMTPGRWFLAARLNGALRDLLACNHGGSISSIATKWGFRHMPRFADYYRRAFGERPSETLRRVRAGH